MPTVDVHVQYTRKITARARQVGALLDAPLTATPARDWRHVLPFEERPWAVGLIVGPSGAGKTQLINELWGGEAVKRVDGTWGSPIVGGFDWSGDRSLVDDFPRDMPVKQLTALLTSVGLGDVPAWLRPYRTLSNGEQFRASMARAIAEMPELIVVDEFTSVVDRQVAKVASHAVQKTTRRAKRQLVAVTCHYDVEDWLQPDWVYDVAAQRFAWRSVQPRPTLTLDIHAADHTVWPVFAHHHYLSRELSTSAKCFTGWVDGQLVAFMAYIHFPHPRTRNIKMGHRLVVLPDWQGLGIGGVMHDWLGQHLAEQGFRYRNVIAHPALIRYYGASPRWRLTGNTARNVKTSATRRDPGDLGLRRMALDPRRLATRSFEYMPPAGSLPPVDGGRGGG